jgi:hypothetical protein
VSVHEQLEGGEVVRDIPRLCYMAWGASKAYEQENVTEEGSWRAFIFVHEGWIRIFLRRLMAGEVTVESFSPRILSFKTPPTKGRETDGNRRVSQGGGGTQLLVEPPHFRDVKPPFTPLISNI